jgi:hypothetical protein
MDLYKAVMHNADFLTRCKSELLLIQQQSLIPQETSKVIHTSL